MLPVNENLKPQYRSSTLIESVKILFPGLYLPLITYKLMTEKELFSCKMPAKPVMHKSDQNYSSFKKNLLHFPNSVKR